MDPYTIIRNVHNRAYELNFQADNNLHPMFNAGSLKPHKEPHRLSRSTNVVLVDGSDDQLVNRFLDKCRRKQRAQFPVEWHAYPLSVEVVGGNRRIHHHISSVDAQDGHVDNHHRTNQFPTHPTLQQATVQALQRVRSQALHLNQKGLKWPGPHRAVLHAQEPGKPKRTAPQAILQGQATWTAPQEPEQKQAHYVGNQGHGPSQVNNPAALRRNHAPPRTPRTKDSPAQPSKTHGKPPGTTMQALKSRIRLAQPA
ncbi:hypothetical protein PI125_g14237 [Phytophthora idaei]|nr:hypothetical protein PI125_g14237 [Phytophthora idaei]